MTDPRTLIDVNALPQTRLESAVMDAIAASVHAGSTKSAGRIAVAVFRNHAANKFTPFTASDDSTTARIADNIFAALFPEDAQRKAMRARVECSREAEPTKFRHIFNHIFGG